VEALKGVPPVVVPSGGVIHNSGYIPPSIAPHHEHEHGATTMSEDALSSIGIALVLGFIFMLLVDQCSRSGHSRDLESSASHNTKRSFTATLGLVVHAAGNNFYL
jgi:zinc transporter 9